ncbi:MAG: FliM/FliN family flagellar motor switch protein [Chlamydiales bacterium]|nr:FliM/FliN family flagellar motor switch protein [Chlamydiales bacterium]
MEIEELSFDVKALIGKIEIPVSTYLGLQVGDILLLDQRIEEPFMIEAGEELCFSGRPGLSATRKAVRIDERIYTRRD